MKKKTKIRNAYAISAKSKKAGKIVSRSKKRTNGKNKQRELLKEATE